MYHSLKLLEVFDCFPFMITMNFFLMSNSVLTCVKKRCVRLVLQSKEKQQINKKKNRDVAFKDWMFLLLWKEYSVGLYTGFNAPELLSGYSGGQS